MAYTSSSSSSSSSLNFEVSTCSKACLKTYQTLKEQYDSLSSDYKKSQFNLLSYKAVLQSVEERLVHYKKNEAVFTEKINILNLEVKLRDNALVVYTKNLEKAKKERDELKLTLEKYQDSSKSLNTLLESQVSDKVKTRLGYKAASHAEESFVKSSKILENLENVKSRSHKGYHAVPPPYTGNYIPPKPNLMFIDEQVKSESVDVVSNVASSDVKTVMPKRKSVDVKNKGVYSTIETKTVRKNNFSPRITEDWNSDDESEVEFEPKLEVKTVRPCNEKIKFVKTAREKEEKVETPKQHKYYPRGNQRNWNNLMSQRLGSNFKMINKACYVYGSFKHLEVLDLEKTKIAQAKKIVDLKKRVKKLERKRRFRTSGMNFFKIGTSRRRSLGEEDASKQGRNLKQNSIFKENDFDVQAMMDVDYELAVRLRAEEQRRKPLAKAQEKNQI
nr:retrotransposon Orf1 [Tanacetum cinerariifolium]